MGIYPFKITVLGGSGSLIIAPQVIGAMHTAKGYIHIFDNASLEIVMSTLDTITDFFAYLAKMERFIQSGQLLWAAGEDDLLAYYLKDLNSKGEHDFIVPESTDVIGIDEGFWDGFVKSPQRKAQIEANRVIYLLLRIL